MKAFYNLLINSTIAGIINFTVWFAITFYVYLQTKSVFATGTIAGIYLVMTAATGIWFGALVDHHKKKNVMLVSSIVSLIFYLISFVVYQSAGQEALKDPASISLWAFVLLLMGGVMVGNIRNIVLPTLVTFLVPEKIHDKANGLVGAASGISFSITSIISGFLVARSGMFDVLILAIIVTFVAIIHLLFVKVIENKIVHVQDLPKKIDLRGTLAVIGTIPGMSALIVFNVLNNLLGGVFMTLMDAYGLSLVSVSQWGIVLGITSTGFIAGGLFIAKLGLGKNPVRSILLANIAMWIVSIFFPLYPSIILVGIGFFLYMAIFPYIEASEQTVIQKVVPPERQGRIFGFNQSIEQAASPLTAFMIGPITQFLVIPFMTTGSGARTIGGWFGTGPDRGIALVFVLTGIIGLIMTLIAMRSKYYHHLSKRYLAK